MSLPLFVTIARREKARRIAVAAFFTVSASWLLCMPVTAACGFELPKTVYFLVQKVQYDENARLMRYIGAFSNLSDCVAERDRPGQVPHLTCVPNGPPGEDT